MKDRIDIKIETIENGYVLTNYSIMEKYPKDFKFKIFTSDLEDLLKLIKSLLE